MHSISFEENPIPFFMQLDLLYNEQALCGTQEAAIGRYFIYSLVNKFHLF